MELILSAFKTLPSPGKALSECLLLLVEAIFDTVEALLSGKIAANWLVNKKMTL